MQCPSCGIDNPAINNFCRDCGTRLQAAAGQSSAEPDSTSSERQGEAPPPLNVTASTSAASPSPLPPQRPSWDDAFWGPPLSEAPPVSSTLSSLFSRVRGVLSSNRRLAGTVAAAAAALTATVLLISLLASPPPREALSSSQGVDYISLARVRMSSGDYDGAIQMLQARLQEDPHDPTATALLDEAHRQAQAVTQPTTLQPPQQANDPALTATVERMFGGSSQSPSSSDTAPRRSYGTPVRAGTPTSGTVEVSIPSPWSGGYSTSPTPWAPESLQGEPVPGIPLMAGPGRPWLRKPGQSYSPPIGWIPLPPSMSPPTPQPETPVTPAVSPPSGAAQAHPPSLPAIEVKPPTSPGAAAEGNFTPPPTLTVRPATNFLGQARAHQVKAQQLRRENRLEAARREYRAAINSCLSAVESGELRAEAESIRSACEAALRSLEF